MLNDKLQPFYQAIHTAMLEVGNNAPAIADRVLEAAFPETVVAAEREGSIHMLRNGVIAFIAKYLKRSSNMPIAGQGDFSDVEPQFQPIASRLQSNSHYVPSLAEHVPVAVLIKNPPLLDEARKYKRQKGQETLAEAKVLDELYEAVTA